MKIDIKFIDLKEVLTGSCIEFTGVKPNNNHTTLENGHARFQHRPTNAENHTMTIADAWMSCCCWNIIS